MSFIVKKAIQEYAKKKNMQVSGDFYGAMDKFIKNALDEAAERTKANGRKTLKDYDL